MVRFLGIAPLKTPVSADLNRHRHPKEWWFYTAGFFPVNRFYWDPPGWTHM